MLKGMFSKAESVLRHRSGVRAAGGKGGGSWQTSCSFPRQRQMMSSQAKAMGMEKMGDAKFYLRGSNLSGSFLRA